MDMPRAPSSAVVAFCKAMQSETIGLGLAQKNYTIRYMPIRRLKQLQTTGLQNNSELYREAASVHTAPYIPIPLECHLYIPLIIEQWI